MTAALRAPDKREIGEIDQEKGKEKDQCTYYNQEGHWKNECHSSNGKEKEDHQILQQAKNWWGQGSIWINPRSPKWLWE